MHVASDGTDLRFGSSHDGANPVWIESTTLAAFMGTVDEIYVGGFYEPSTGQQQYVSYSIVCYDDDGDARVVGNDNNGSSAKPWFWQPPLAADFVVQSGDATVPTLADDGDLGLLIDFGAPSTSDVSRIARKAITDPSGDWSVEMAFEAQFQSTNYTGVGIILRDSVGGRQITIRWTSATVGGNILSATWWNSLTVFNTEKLARNYAYIGGVLWLRVRKEGGTFYFDRSPNGKQWVTHYSEATNAFLANPADQIGIVATNNNPNADSRQMINVLRWKETGI